MSNKKTFNISELSQEFDVTTRSIRFYEDQGLLNPTRRGQTRIFSNKDRVRLKLILRGKRMGFSLAQTKELFDLWDETLTGRSEEHTSELQSRPHLVCRLLLEKKNLKTQLFTCVTTSSATFEFSIIHASKRMRLWTAVTKLSSSSMLVTMP